MIPVPAPIGKPYRVSSESAWPLRSADGRTWAQVKADREKEWRK
jgi:hypothetical protein